jgi:hypothetical protein
VSLKRTGIGLLKTFTPNNRRRPLRARSVCQADVSKIAYPFCDMDYETQVLAMEAAVMIIFLVIVAKGL